MVTEPQVLDADFSREILRELYSYPRKRRSVAWFLWLTLGWAGAHRFYLGRELTGLTMLLSGGGFLLWWAVDGFQVGSMVRAYNVDQELRRAERRPPRALEAMPALDQVDPTRPPAWIVAWRARGPLRRRIRFAGDVLVLGVATVALGVLLGNLDGAFEAVVAVVVLAGLTAMGAGPAWLDRLPLGRDVQRWSHRLRLFYLYNPPASPLLLLVRPLVGLLWAPFRSKDRAEVRLYGELGAVFATLFLLLEVIPGIVVPALLPGRSVHLGQFVLGFIGQAFSTFFIVYAFATPVGAILVRYLLLEPTHRVPRVLAVLTLVFIGLGALAGI